MPPPMNAARLAPRLPVAASTTLPAAAAPAGPAAASRSPAPAPARLDSFEAAPARAASTGTTPGGPLRVPEKNLAPGAKGEDVKHLQDCLTLLGYLDGQVQLTSGYGTYGQKTSAAVHRFQQQNKIRTDARTGDAPGRYGEATRAKLQELMAGVKADGLGPARTTEDAKKFHLTQWGPTPYNAGGTQMGFADCGPTSGVIALTALGLMKQPTPEQAPRAIDRMRDLCDGRDGNHSHLMDWGTLRNGLARAGAQSAPIRGGMAGVDAALARGNPIIAGGQNPWGAWGRSERIKGNYLAMGNGGHFVAIVGKQADGKYIVADPLLVNTPIAVTADQLKLFASGPHAGAIEVARAR